MPLAGQFAGYLRTAREAAGLTQASLAETCGLTGSYISLLESGKKPAPSDKVVRRLAAALHLDSEDALHVAHLDRAPADLQRALERFRREALIERQLRERTAEALFPLSLWGLLPSVLPGKVKAAVGDSLDTPLVEAIDRLQEVARGALDLSTFHRETRRVLDGLDPERRRLILDAAPGLAEGGSGPDLVRSVIAPEPALPPDVLPGDVLAVDASLDPAPGDLVVVLREGRREILRHGPGVTGVEGVVVELRRRVKGPPR